MKLIWATRGRTWGFRFLRDGGFADPLPVYDNAFAGAPTVDRVCYRTGTTVAIRFPDPLGRTDSAGRTIPHEFVIFPPQTAIVTSIDDAMVQIWPTVEAEFAAIWDSSGGL
ncbi:hypothetical protein [Nocardioides marmoribigeumensis]|uniref:Uncharacterized protein n=1 Tax=Nocardioides marmoribigeumensis TaxID=433649 RepID=A0ABU2BY86_9ACTN|nr:hypothetical protein [Nocardioides marmoribigeumensis]MDR7363355.1 hypothetical protein [Nocardioides marmoribigeumensis]